MVYVFCFLAQILHFELLLVEVEACQIRGIINSLKQMLGKPRLRLHLTAVVCRMFIFMTGRTQAEIRQVTQSR